MNEAQRSEESGDEGANLTGLLCVCDCYPEHCLHGDACWCEPEIKTIGDNKVIIHKEAN